MIETETQFRRFTPNSNRQIYEAKSEIYVLRSISPAPG